jgi:hypothetical protein
MVLIISNASAVVIELIVIIDIHIVLFVLGELFESNPVPSVI